MVGSWKTYCEQTAVLVDFGFGIFFDLLTIGIILTGIKATAGTPHGKIFVAHILLALLGLLGFVGIFFFIRKHGDHLTHPQVGKLALFVFFPCWLLGAGLAIINRFI